MPLRAAFVSMAKAACTPVLPAESSGSGGSTDPTHLASSFLSPRGRGPIAASSCLSALFHLSSLRRRLVSAFVSCVPVYDARRVSRDQCMRREVQGTAREYTG